MTAEILGTYKEERKLGEFNTDKTHRRQVKQMNYLTSLNKRREEHVSQRQRCNKEGKKRQEDVENHNRSCVEDTRNIENLFGKFQQTEGGLSITKTKILQRCKYC